MVEEPAPMVDARGVPGARPAARDSSLIGPASRSTDDVPLADVLFAVVDIETSGLKPNRHRVLQIAVVTARSDGSIVDRWVSYLRPRHRWVFRRGPVRIHRITRAQLRSAPTASSVLDEFARRVEGKVLAAHNLRFDGSFLDRALTRQQITSESSARLCTLLLSRSLDPERTYSHGLASLCKRYGVELANHHDALADAEATAALLPHLLSAAGATTIADLVS